VQELDRQPGEDESIEDVAQAVEPLVGHTMLNGRAQIRITYIRLLAERFP